AHWPTHCSAGRGAPFSVPRRDSELLRSPGLGPAAWKMNLDVGQAVLLRSRHSCRLPRGAGVGARSALERPASKQDCLQHVGISWLMSISSASGVHRLVSAHGARGMPETQAPARVPARHAEACATSYHGSLGGPMRIWQLEAFGEPEDMTLAEVDLPNP